MSTHKLFAQRIGLVALVNLFANLSVIILLPILTKNMPIEEYGIWVQIGVTISLIPVITTLGLPQALVRFLAAAKKREEIQDGFYSIVFIVVGISAIVSLSIFLFSDIIAAFLFNNNVLITQILSLIVFMACLENLSLTFFRTFQYIKKYCAFSVASDALNIILIVLFILGGYGIIGAAIGLLISYLILFSIMSLNIVHKIGFKIPEFKCIKKYLNYGIPTIPTNLSSWMVRLSDRYIITILLGVAFVGYYSPGYSLGNMIIMFISPLGLILPPVLSKYYDENNITNVKTILRYSLKYFLLLAIPSVFGLSFLSSSLLEILSTPEIAFQGYLITSFVAVSTLLYGVYVIFAQIIALEKKTKITGSIWTISAVLNIGLNIVILPYVGILGAAITTLIGYAFVCVLTIYYSHKYLKIYFDTNSTLKSILASALMSLILVCLNPVGGWNILLLVGLCSLSYTVILFALKVIKKDEIKFFKDLLKL